MELNNIFESIPDNLNEEVFNKLLQNKTIKIERIISKGHISPEKGWYDQALNEWLIILKGRARILFYGEEEINLRAGDYLNIPAHKKHKVSWTDTETETIWLAIHYES